MTCILGVGVLADWIRAATEQLAKHTGPAVGGLLTISLGSLAELLLALFVLVRGSTCARERPEVRLRSARCQRRRESAHRRRVFVASVTTDGNEWPN